MVIHIAYYIALTGAYKHGDLGLTYPLMRGTAPLLVALSASFALGETLSPLAWAGVVGVCGGVLALGLSRHAMDRPKAVGFALSNAVVIALYTVVDALGVRAASAAGGNAFQYVAALFVLDGWPFALLVFWRRGAAVMWPYARVRWPVALGAAAASLGSYGIALWAMTRAPVATVAALRETSVLFAALLGSWFLKESFTARRAMGTAVIVAGVMALRLG
jgi:phosphonate utilization associated putative membrane protein